MRSFTPPTASELGALAQRDIRVAAAVARATQVQSIKAEMRFVEGAIGTLAPDAAFEQQPQPIYGFDWNYSVSQPEYMAGSVQRMREANANAQSPGINVSLNVSQGWGPSNWFVNYEDTAIESLFRWAGKDEGNCCDWTSNALIHSWQRVKVRGVLGRAYAAEGEVPVIVQLNIRFAYLGPYVDLGLEECCETLGRLNVLGLPRGPEELGRLRSHLAGFDQAYRQLTRAPG